MTAETFRELHAAATVLVLPNAWDAGSARLIESVGAKAIATTSAGVAWSRGYPDGDALPVELLLAATSEIARVVRVPLSVDIEGGYSGDPGVVAKLSARLIDAGAAGINIEDGAGTAELLAAKIEAIRHSADRAGLDLFINARCDVLLRDLASGDAAVEEVVRRAARYRDAGCDGLFVPYLADGRAIGAVARGVAPLPLNIMLVPGLAGLDVLYQQGVRRLSSGSGIAEAVLGHAGRLAEGFLAGDLEEIFVGAADYTAMNALFAPR